MEETNSENARLIFGDCMDAMRGMADNTFDSIVCDPPYGLNFMGKDFDNPKMMWQSQFLHGGLKNYPIGVKRTGFADCDMVMFQNYMMPIFAEALRVSKPGAFLCAFGATRTYHRLVCAIEDAGWEILDCVFFCHSQGFPKGLDISKSIDKKLGAKREVVGTATNGAGANLVKIQNHGPGDTGIGKWDGSGKVYDITAPATEEAKKWEGFNTQIKPAVEPIVIARKPVDGSVTENVMKWGTGAFNIDACRIPTTEPITIHSPARKTLYDSGHADLGTWQQTKGRWPANFVHDGSDEVLALFPNTGKSSGGGMHTKGIGGNQSGICLGKYSNGKATEKVGFGDSGSAARFFYCAKPSRKERGGGNTRPTVKALSLMRWLVRLVTRKGGLVLDPFMGSGTTGVACAVEGMRFVGCEKEPAYFEIAKRRIGGTGFGMEVDGEEEAEDVSESTYGAERQSASTSQPSKPGLVQGELFG